MVCAVDPTMHMGLQRHLWEPGRQLRKDVCGAWWRSPQQRLHLQDSSRQQVEAVLQRWHANNLHVLCEP